MILQDLTSSAGEDAVLAMNTFIKRLLAVSGPDQMKVSLKTDSNFLIYCWIRISKKKTCSFFKKIVYVNRVVKGSISDYELINLDG
jgi:hypothetical protein